MNLRELSVQRYAKARPNLDVIMPVTIRTMFMYYLGEREPCVDLQNSEQPGYKMA